MKLKGVLLVLAVAALWPAAGNAASLRGTVVARSHGTMLVATPSGVVQAVRGSAAVGSRVVGSHVVGHATRARIHGIVVKRVGSTLFLSSNRHLLAVHTRTPAAVAPVPGSSVGAQPGSAQPGSAQPGSAQPGSVVDATVGVQPNGQLDEENEDDVGQAGSSIQVQATITAVGAGTVTVSVNGQSLTVNLPNGLTLPSTVVGQTVTFTVSLGGGGDQGDDQGDGDGGGGDD